MPNQDVSSFYQILELEPGASAEQVRSAYKELAKVWHPDRFAGDPKLQQRAQEKLKQINEAYAFLQDHFAAEQEGASQATGLARNTARQQPNVQQPPPDHAKKMSNSSEGLKVGCLLTLLAFGGFVILILMADTNVNSTSSGRGNRRNEPSGGLFSDSLQLPREELDKLEGTLRIQFHGWIKANIYNGTEGDLDTVTVLLIVSDEAGNEILNRRYELSSQFGHPLGSSEFIADAGFSLQPGQTHRWGIVSATWEENRTPKELRSAPGEKLSAADLDKLEGTLEIQSHGWIKANIYNGTEGDLDTVTVLLIVSDEAGNEILNRRYELSSQLGHPLGSSEFIADAGFSLRPGQTHKWGIVSATWE